MATVEKQLPKEIKDFINSGRAISEIDNIAEKAEIYNVSSLYSIIFQLIRKEIPASDFVNELSRELGWDREMSIAVAHEIKEKVLSQIKYSIKDWGVDIEDIETPNPTPLEKLSLSNILGDLGIEETKETTEEGSSDRETQEESISISKDLEGPKTTQVPISKSTTQEETEKKQEAPEKEEFKPKEKPKKEVSDDPFILHQEESDKGPQKRQEVERRKRSFSFSKDGFFDSSKEEDSSSPKAQIETPGGKSSKKGGGFFGFGKKKKQKDKKVVHYSDNRTSLSKDDNGSFINLSKLEPDEKKKPTPQNKTDQKDSFEKNFQKNKTAKPENKASSSEGLALGNVNEKSTSEKPKKKNFSQENKKDDDNEEGPHLDGNTVDLSKK